MDDFLVWLVTGLALMALLIILFGGKPTVEEREGTVISEDYIGMIGPKNMEIYRRIDVPEFDTSKLSFNREFTVGDKTVKNGLLSGADSLSYRFDIDASNAKKAYIRFEVADTNNYGPLRITVNDHEIENKRFERGLHTIDIELKFLKNSNVIKFSAGSSGWKLWAPTVYELNNITVVVSEYSINKMKYDFEIYEDEYKNLTRGKLIFHFNKNRGTISVNINGYEIFNGESEYAKELLVDKSMFVQGQNLIEIEPGENSEYAGHGFFMIFYNTDRERVLEKSFNISHSNYLTFSRGDVRFEIDKIAASGKMIISVIDSDGQEHQIGRESVGTGEFFYTFDKADIKEGENKLIIRSDGSSIFRVTNLRIYV
ncbi:MAG: hypothetical protein B6U68_01960 [Candidatus Aenigmarchaeota archaeon ex4484_14]|nr:hypothetical protein [Candidatus Aenigmarchaeota archaeon]OYT57350.1 MAG: hypothetical protein B6U68_01960 [Candidatus Aenigmarchaeota archaeon ex4484_14]